MQSGVQYSTVETALDPGSGYSRFWLWIQEGVQYFGYRKGPSTVDTARGSVLWILLGILALDTARKCPSLWIKPVVRDVDTARGSGSGYSKRFSTLDTAIGSVIEIQPGVLILDTAIGSGSGYNKGSSAVDTARGSVLRIQLGLQYSGYNQEFWLWIQPWTRDSSTWDLSRDIEQEAGYGSKHGLRFIWSLGSIS